MRALPILLAFLVSGCGRAPERFGAGLSETEKRVVEEEARFLAGLLRGAAPGHVLLVVLADAGVVRAPRQEHLVSTLRAELPERGVEILDVLPDRISPDGVHVDLTGRGEEIADLDSDDMLVSLVGVPVGFPGLHDHLLVVCATPGMRPEHLEPTMGSHRRRIFVPYEHGRPVRAIPY